MGNLLCQGQNLACLIKEVGTNLLLGAPHNIAHPYMEEERAAPIAY